MGLASVILIQIGAFAGPLAFGMNGVISGQLAGLLAIVVWFCGGVPLSYKALELPAIEQPRLAIMKVRRQKSDFKLQTSNLQGDTKSCR